MEGTWKQLKQ